MHLFGPFLFRCFSAIPNHMPSENLKRSIVVVVGGTGITGQRILMQALDSLDLGVAAEITGTSRTVSLDGQAKTVFPAGDLASTLAPNLKEASTQSKIHWRPLDFQAQPETFRVQLDELLKLEGTHKVLFLAGALTNVEACETNPALCRLVNVERSIAILEAGLKLGYHVVFFSSDYVFDGEAGPYAEDAKPQPLNHYGESKFEVEQWLQQQPFKNFTVVRTTGVYDFVPGSKNFLMQMCALTESSNQFLVPRDQFGTPIWAEDLAKVAWQLAQGQSTGIFHAGGKAYLSRDQFAYEILNLAQIPTNKITPVLTAELTQKAKRPLNAGLLNIKTFKTLGWEPRSPQEILPALMPRLP